ncbi:Alpha/Beta hydrolase protein [Xylariaceae sp. FL0662B]|nr:Alpha/Beta hydrolase protein [Xylariaceae sp. FL0662B]
MLSRPTLSFTLPSIHDDTKLSCRIYHPTCLNASPAPPHVRPWRRHAAIVAHPYAPLGGNYDDSIVDLIAGTLLRLGFIVATFNFRGALSSGGRTSWTSKPECADYMSVAGFLVYYVHYLDPLQHPPSSAGQDKSPPTLLLAGYSYGAMVTTKLPPLGHILDHFALPVTHSAAADIRLRAQHLAEQQNAMFTTPGSPRKSLGMRVGGDEDRARGSRDKSRGRSPDDREEVIRRGVRELLARTRLIHKKISHSSQGQTQEVEREEQCLEKVDNLIDFRSAYLVASPPIGIVTNFATMTFSNPFSGWSRRSGHKASPGPSIKDDSSTEVVVGEREQQTDDADAKLIQSPSLAIYGDQDGFVTLRKIRDWASRLGSAEVSRFIHVEVAGAGHFWIEGDVAGVLEAEVYSFVSKLVDN